MDDFIDKVKKLPQDVRDFFISDFLMIEMKKSFLVFNVNSALSKDIVDEVGEIFTGDFDLKNLPDVIAENIGIDQAVALGISYEMNRRIFNRFPDYFKDSPALLKQWEPYKKEYNLTENEIYKKITELEPWILDIEKEKQEELEQEKETANRESRRSIKSLVDVKISEALKEYPKIGEQAITSEMIKIRIFPTPVRPSIKNWIEDYQSVMGAGRHGMMERGNYLFHSENTKKLTAGDRKKLAEVLRSLDEDVTLKIDPENQEIFFEETSESSKIPASIISDQPVQPVQPIQQPVQKVEKPPIQQSPIVNLSSKSGPRPVLPVQAIPFQKPVQMQNYPAKPVFSQKGESRISSGDVSRPTIQKPEYNPRADFQKQNVNNFFKSEQIKPEQPKPAFQEKKQNDYFSRYTSNAGKSWEEVSKEDDSFSNNNPKIVGNIVDLKG